MLLLILTTAAAELPPPMGRLDARGAPRISTAGRAVQLAVDMRPAAAQLHRLVASTATTRTTTASGRRPAQ